MSREPTTEAPPTTEPPNTAPYFIVYAILIAGVGATVGAAYLPLGELNLAVALTIACIKGLLVALYFMHLRDSPRLTWLVACGSFVWFVILIVGVLTDYYSRGFRGENWTVE